MADVRLVPLLSVRADPQAQPRTAINTDLIESYTDDMIAGAEFPPLVTFFDGNLYWLGDGFHRFYAYKGLGLVDVPADVRDGGLRDAVLFSCSANGAHGLRRTDRDKRRAICRLLEDGEWRKWSDREIARHCGVDHKTVGRTRADLEQAYLGNSPDSNSHWTPGQDFVAKHSPGPVIERLVSRGGTTYTQNTANIGRRPEPTEREAWTPRDMTSPEPRELSDAERRQRDRDEQIARDNANGHISFSLWEIQKRLDQLPSPEEAINRFPVSHYHTLSSAMLRDWSEWFSRAADAWDRTVGDAQHVAAE